GGGALLVISLGVVVALMLSRRVSSSLRSLASAAAAMNSGAPVRVPRSRVQEVKAIGEALLAVHRERERSEEHRALLLADAEHRRRAAESLNDVKALVSESLEPESVAQAVVNAMARLLGAPMVVLYRTDPDSSDLVLVSEVGAPERRGWHIPRAAGTVAMALETGTPVQSACVLTGPRVTPDRLHAPAPGLQPQAAPGPEAPERERAGPRHAAGARAAARRGHHGDVPARRRLGHGAGRSRPDRSGARESARQRA